MSLLGCLDSGGLTVTSEQGWALTFLLQWLLSPPWPGSLRGEPVHGLASRGPCTREQAAHHSWLTSG